MIPDWMLFHGKRYDLEPLPERPDLWELVVGQADYPAPCPAVVVLKDDPHAFFRKQTQFFVRAINGGMSIQHVSALYGSDRWFFNNEHGIPPCHNYLTGTGSDVDPNADKVRSCLHNVVTGVQQGDSVYITTFDSRELPPLKPGRTYPETVEDIRLDDYLITPRTHPWMFVVANIINRDGEVVPFPNGAIYPWTGDNLPYSFLPLISNHGYGNVFVSASKLRKLEAGEPIPSPYRRT